MLRRLLGTRGFMSIALAVVLALIAAGAYTFVLHPRTETESYCALMPDSIGLYVGNHVTMRGIPVGAVTGIHPRGRTVRVDFTVDTRYPVAPDASATTVSDTIVADRNLAVLGIGDAARHRDPARCITRTLTPKSLTQTIDALAQLSQQTLGLRSGTQDALRRGIGALNSATTGTGPQLHDIIEKLGTTMNSPDGAIRHLAGTIDALTAISGSVAGHWADIKSMMLRLAEVLDQVDDELLGRTVEIINGFQRVLPMLNDITTMFGDPIFRVLDAAVPLVRLIHANVDTLRDIITRIPVLGSAAITALDPARGIAYAPPKVAVPQLQAQQLCALAAGDGSPACVAGANGTTVVPLARLIFAMTGAR
jgi:virulence factor Mce-like protein